MSGLGTSTDVTDIITSQSTHPSWRFQQTQYCKHMETQCIISSACRRQKTNKLLNRSTLILVGSTRRSLVCSPSLQFRVQSSWQTRRRWMQKFITCKTNGGNGTTWMRLGETMNFLLQENTNAWRTHLQMPTIVVSNIINLCVGGCAMLGGHPCFSGLSCMFPGTLWS